MLLCLFFFFSSRRRHTRFKCDWSSDVCSSDLCAGHLSIMGLKRLGLYPLPEGIVENTFNSATFFSPNCTPFSVRLATPVTCAVNLVLFDKYLAEQAQNAGAQIYLYSRVEKLAFGQQN